MSLQRARTRWMATAAAVALAAGTAVAQQQKPAGTPQSPAGAQQPPAAGTQKPNPADKEKLLPAGQGGKQANPGGFQRTPSLPFPDAPQEVQLVGTSVRVVPMAKGLVNPWSIAFLPNGDMLVTEKPGRLRIVRNGKLDPEPVAGTPQVLAVGQGGLLEVAVHPQFEKNGYVYLTYSKPGEQPNTGTTALARGRFDGKALVDVKDILVAENWNKGGIHFGSKLAFGPDGLLYMSLGERTDRERSQSLMSHGGKILRLKDDGTVPPDNPFVGRKDAKPEIFSYGHRNPQGLAFHPQTGALWSNEHGPQGGDELNIIEAGKNYGWPIATYGREYAPNGAIIAQEPVKEGVVDPLIVWSPSIGISGLMFYTGDQFPYWKGQSFSGGLSGQALYRVGFDDKLALLGREPLLGSLRLRIRDVRQGPDGNIYLAVDANPGGVLRVEPAAGGTSTDGAPKPAAR